MLCSYPPSSPHELSSPIHSPCPRIALAPSPRTGVSPIARKGFNGLRIVTALSASVCSPQVSSAFSSPILISPFPATTSLSVKRPRSSSPPITRPRDSAPYKRNRPASASTVPRKVVRFAEPVALRPHHSVTTMGPPQPPPLERSSDSGSSTGSTSSSASSSKSASTVTPSLLRSVEEFKLGSSSETERGSRSPPFSSTGWQPVRRVNPKGLSLSLASSFHATTEDAPTPISPSASRTAYQTPSTAGPPRTPAPGASSSSSGSWGRSSAKEGRRPSLLSLITHPPGNDGPVPTTPGRAVSATATMRSRGHARNGSAGSQMAAFSNYSTEMDPRGSRSAYPSLRGSSFAPIDERHTNRLPINVASSSSMSASSASTSESVSSTPSTSPPGASGDEGELSYPGGSLPAEPYADGPIEVIPGVWLGAEDSLWCWDVWAGESKTVSVLNVAQEIENPLDPETPQDSWEWNPTGKAKVALSEHDSSVHPKVEYAHLRWSHGEGGLANIPTDARLDNLDSEQVTGSESEKWRFWEAIQWLESRRRAGIPVMIHCQCGVSRSATLAVAYVMTLAAAGLVPSVLGDLRTMQDAYDFVKNKSPWIGPNVR